MDLRFLKKERVVVYNHSNGAGKLAVPAAGKVWGWSEHTGVGRAMTEGGGSGACRRRVASRGASKQRTLRMGEWGVGGRGVGGGMG